MNEFDSPNYTEYTYDKKAEGKTLLLKYLLILGYAVFVVAYFLVCYITRIIPLFAICPLITWIIVYFTWRLVSFDVFYKFEHGHMEFGKVKIRKSGRLYSKKLELDVQGAYAVIPYPEAKSSEEYKAIGRTYDYSSSRNASSLIIIIFEGRSGKEAVVFDSTPNLVKLLKKYSQNTVNL